MHITAPKFMLLSMVLVLCLTACAPTSGIFAGGDWQSSGLPHHSIQALAVDFNNPQNIYAGGSVGKVFASTDGGQHWSDRSTGLPPASSINALAFDATGKKLYAATDVGLFGSTDAALHWLAIGKADQSFDYTALAFDLKATQTLYVGTASHGVLLSLDGGNSWSSINTGLPARTSINALTVDPDSEQLWAATNVGVYRSDDKGKTWQAFDTDLSTSMVYSVQPDTVVNGGTRGLIFAGTNHGFYFSQDDGGHWKTSPESLIGTNIHVIYVDFHKPSTLFVGTDVGALRSDDSGQTWSGLGPGMPKGQPVYSLAWGTSEYSQLFAAADDVYLYPGTSGGLTFNRLIALVIAALFFYLLYRLVRRRRKVRPLERPLEQSEGGEERSTKDGVV